jgi:hypothetical protein
VDDRALMRRLAPRRPFTALTAIGTAAHHGFELASGVGLVFEPFLGRRGAIALWATQLPAWLVQAWVGGERFDRVLALSNGMGFAGALVHFAEWPWELRHGIPTLTEAEGLTAEQLPAYNLILQGWAVSGALALLFETPGRARRWALGGLVMGEPLRRSARHHFRWAREQARKQPERWSPALREPAGCDNRL